MDSLQLNNLMLTLENANADYQLINDKIEFGSAEFGAKQHNIPLSLAAPTLILKIDNEMTACIIRGDTKICLKKLKKELKTNKLRFATAEEVSDVTDAAIGYVSLINLSLKTIIDHKILEKHYIYGGCGIPSYTLKIQANSLTKITNAKLLDFSKPKAN